MSDLMNAMLEIFFNSHTSPICDMSRRQEQHWEGMSELHSLIYMTCPFNLMHNPKEYFGHHWSSYFSLFQKLVITPVKKELGLAFKGNQRMVVEALEVIDAVILCACLIVPWVFFKSCFHYLILQIFSAGNAWERSFGYEGCSWVKGGGGVWSVYTWEKCDY